MILGTIIERLTRTPGRAFLVVFLLAVAVRCALLPLLPPALVTDPGSELREVAVNLARTGEFANPYRVPTGPTAHVPPVWAGVQALILRLFGFTVAAGWARIVLVIASYSAMYAMIPWLAAKFGLGREAGFLGGVAGALTPHGVGEVSMAWEEVWAAMALGLLLVAFLRRWAEGSTDLGRSFLLGIACGAAFHLAPTLMPVVAGCMVFELWWSRDRGKWAWSAAIAVGILVACLPWGVRNYLAFQEVFFIRSNLGLELRLGNHDGAEAAFNMTYARERSEFRHPHSRLQEAMKVRELGEMEYMRRSMREALEWIGSHPGRFVRLTVLRVIHFWFGPLHWPPGAVLVTALTILALLGAVHVLPNITAPQRAAILIPLAAYPLIYYLVNWMFRYRVPVHWILLALAGAEVWRWIGAASGRESEGRPD